MELTTGSLIAELATKVRNLSHGSRYILGIAGIPGAGKSTLAEQLARGVNKQFFASSETLAKISPALVVPMDGFHLSNEKLEDLRLLHLKGIPDSFDAAGFVELLRSLRSNTTTAVYAPLFDRRTESSIEAGIVIKPEHKLCIVEGNYLLLAKNPWSEARQYFDQTWFLDVGIETVYPRLLSRHLLVKSESDAREKIESTDLPNARLILDTANRADRLVKTMEEPGS
jgi:pantothenate kinase